MSGHLAEGLAHLRRTGYDPWNRRVMQAWTDGDFQMYGLTLCGLDGQPLGQVSCIWNGGCQPLSPQRYFGGKRLGAATDRLGSVRGRYDTINGASNTTYYPYGEDKDNPQPDGAFGFATYTKDVQGLDYAMNRYYSNVLGRFYSPDPAPSANAVALPGNWNRYAYVGGDPVNKTDPYGLCSPDDDPPCYSMTGVDTPEFDFSSDWGLEYLLGYTPYSQSSAKRQQPKWKAPFATARSVFKGDAKTISTMKFSQPCNNDLTALGTNVAAVQNGAANAQFLDGAGSAVTMASLYASSPVASIANLANAVTGTVGSTIASNAGIVALSQLGGSAIYLNSSMIDPSDYYQDISTVLHEVLHNVTGLTDPDIEKALSLAQNGVSDVITQKLKTDCF